MPLRSLRGGSKLAEVIALLSRKGGANMGDLISATGWLPHTTRAALTVLRKRGYGVERTPLETLD
jgi:DNA-binding MarR family transcriptional regulator